ncbi:YhcN/YlaJ family sporulation lipoprotein [Parageobacillus thermoglucosidasius]|uniref:YhcN/YlaJ family sporulation lipoprotein n=1 Tax=Parageobacillus thermoglucosidasius TaxID=1426 RepID=A0AB38QWD2_PARTM|nr:YhcN/YlaJ family sporulation lipoprotein [Parageobacillus thermoglucosidasius]UOE75907.1 YhcN/YlaJ family sporulation lipoprotein [Parageobacillus thermoglucosidasius]
MRKALLAVTLSAATLAGCAQTAQDNNTDVYKRSGNTINVTDRNDLYNENGVPNGDDTRMDNFGYVRHQKSPVPSDANLYNNMPTFNRERAADLISKLCTQLPNVNDAATLVTDEEVLIVYDTDTKNRHQTADQVKKTALSVVPRYYHVYVADDPRLMKDIERFGRLDSNSRNIDQIIDTTIQRMLKYPQGRKLSDEENENGEMIHETNDRLDRDFHDERPAPAKTSR